MKVAIGADHRGIRYKAIIRKQLEHLGHSVQDFGTPYTDFGTPFFGTSKAVTTEARGNRGRW